jgi:hypothetical protein
MSVQIVEVALGCGLGRIPVRVPRFARTAAAFASVGGTLDHVEEQIVIAA